MADLQEVYNGSTTSYLFGRRTIYASFDDITPENVINAVNEALNIHTLNLLEEETLYWYRRGVQPILWREKEIRPEINNKVSENHAEEIVSFKDGYFLTKPAFYVARNENADTIRQVDELNEYLFRSGKQQADNEVVDWFHTVGKAALFVEPVDDADIPFAAHALDPRSAFVVYSMRPGNRPVMGVNVVTVDDKIKIDAYTREAVYRLSGAVSGKLISSEKNYEATAISVDAIESNPLRKIPIIEYQYNSVGMGAFEAVIPLLNAINRVQSNRLDGIEQMIQSLLVFYNCQLGEDENGNPISPDYVRAAGALFLQSTGENKADLKEIVSNLDQTQTQELVDNLYQQVLTISGMPSTTKGGKSTSDTGTAVLARDGWYQAETFARNTEDLFKKSNRRFDEIVLEILRRKGLTTLKLSDFDLEISRNETSNIQSKAQAYTTLVQGGFHPILAMQKSGVSNDPVSDFEMSKPYIAMKVGNPDAPQEPQEEIEKEVIVA